MRLIGRNAPAVLAWLIAMIISIAQIKSEMISSGDSSSVESALDIVGWLLILIIVGVLALIFVAGPVWLVTRFLFKIYEAIKPQPSNRHP